MVKLEKMIYNTYVIYYISIKNNQLIILVNFNICERICIMYY